MIELDKVCVIDTETTSWDPEVAKLIQVGAATCVSPGAGRRAFGTYVNPGDEYVNSLQPDVMAVTKIVPKLIRDKGVPTQEALDLLLGFVGDSQVIAAHNWPYDKKVLAKSGLNLDGIDFIDTLRLAKEFYDPGVWVPGGDKLPDFKLGTVYYGVVDPLLRDEYALRAHDAVNDCTMTAMIIEALAYSKKLGVEDMVAICREPFVPRVCPIGKHKGQAWAEVPSDFLQWMVKKKVYEDDVGLEAAVLTELENRGEL